jgi:pimeloyl-ACP methyl ester carboxylesterase
VIKRFFVLTFLILPVSVLISAPLRFSTYRDKGYSVGILEGGRGPHVLLVHGLGVSRASMQKLAELMASSGYHVLLPDIPGQGTTERDERRKYSIDAQALFLKRLLDHKRIDRATVIGNSMGGHIAVSLALLHPQKVKKLVLISPAGLQNGGPPPYSILEIAEDLEETKKKNLEWNNYVRRDIHAGMHYPIDPYLGLIQSPTLIVWGKKDDILPVDLAPIWQRQIPSAQLILLEDLGHMPQDEDPELFLEQIRSFLKSG